MKSKLKIILPIVIAVIAIIIAAFAINFTSDKTVDVSSLITTAQNYLYENEFEQAVAEFNKVIELDSMNVDAYLGLAEAYQGMGDIDKAIEFLKTGYEKTGDQRLKDKLDELSPPEETTVTTTVTTTVMTTEATTTIELVTVPDLAGMTQEEALSICEELGIGCDVKTEASDTVEKDHVISQSVAAGANVPVNYAISVTVSKGKKVDYIIIKGEKYSTSLTELDLSGMELTDEDIKDLDKMTNLEMLDLGTASKNVVYKDSGYLMYNYITNINPFKNLTNLTELDLSGNQISDISSLNNLTNLTSLNIAHNQISDISPLKDMTNLTDLDLWDNQISDISPLKNLTNLTNLDLTGNQISDISLLKNLTNLTVLSLSVNQISDISPLKNLTNLTRLNLNENQISDISPLKDLINLRWLTLGSNPIHGNISSLKNLTNLTNLYLWDNQISDVSPLKNLINLTSLDLQNNQISDDDIKELKKALPDCNIRS